MKTESETDYKALAEHYEKALREILTGSCVTGRWLDDETFECPDGDGAHNPDVEHPGCTWMPYDEDEEKAWLESVADIAERALTTNP